MINDRLFIRLGSSTKKLSKIVLRTKIISVQHTAVGKLIFSYFTTFIISTF